MMQHSIASYSEGSSRGVTIGTLDGQEVPEVLLLLGSLGCPLCPYLGVALLDELLCLRQLDCRDKDSCKSPPPSSHVFNLVAQAAILNNHSED